MPTKIRCVSERTDYTKRFFTHMEQLRRDVLRRRGSYAIDPTTNPQKVLNVVITNNFKFIHLVCTMYDVCIILK